MNKFLAANRTVEDNAAKGLHRSVKDDTKTETDGDGDVSSHKNMNKFLAANQTVEDNGLHRSNYGFFTRFHEWMNQEHHISTNNAGFFTSEWMKQEGQMSSMHDSVKEFIKNIRIPIPEDAKTVPTLFWIVATPIISQTTKSLIHEIKESRSRRKLVKSSPHHEVVENMLESKDGVCISYRFMMNGMKESDIKISLNEDSNQLAVRGSSSSDERKYFYVVDLPDGNFTKATKKTCLENGDLTIEFTDFEKSEIDIPI